MLISATQFDRAHNIRVERIFNICPRINARLSLELEFKTSGCLTSAADKDWKIKKREQEMVNSKTTR